MCSQPLAAAPAAPAAGAAKPRSWHSHEREVYPTILGCDGWPALALYCVEWERDEDWSGYQYWRPTVQLIDLLSLTSGASLRNAAGRRQCAAIIEQLEEHEAEQGYEQPQPFHHYD